MSNTVPTKQKNKVFEQDPQGDLAFVIAIPACQEPEILKTLESIFNCTRPDGSVEIIIVLNSSESASEEITRSNQRAETEILEYSNKYSVKDFRIHCIHEKGIPDKVAGAGMARKIAMDLAWSRFDCLDRPEGIIVSLDADTICEPNYLSELEHHFRVVPGSDACSVYFEHPVDGKEYPEIIYQGIIQYELHLRYYIQALRYAGHPHAYHTLGSCFAVRAGVYGSQGGMNKRKAGEDFYFLHKIIPLENYHEVNRTCLHPSPRPSVRVPFGTGPTIDKFLSGEIRNLESYHPSVFDDLKSFLDTVRLLYPADSEKLDKIFSSYPPSIRENLGSEFFEKILEIRSNSAGEMAFTKRFYRWFTVFRVIKYINQAHRGHYRHLPVTEAAGIFLKKTDPGFEKGGKALEMLEYLRQVQRKL